MAKSTTPVPPGFHTITAHLSVAGGAAAYIEFLKRAFGAVEIRRVPGPGGKLMHALVQIGDSMLMFADDFSAEFGMPPLAQGRMPYQLHIYVNDVDALWNQAVAAGCEVAMPLADQFWGDRYGVLSDKFGNRWAIATHKEDVAPDEMRKRMEKAVAEMQKK